MEAHTQREEAQRDEAPTGRPTLVRLKDGGLALVKTIGGRRMIVRRYGRHEEAEAHAQHGLGPGSNAQNGFGPSGNGHHAANGHGSNGHGANGHGGATYDAVVQAQPGQFQDGAPVVEIVPGVQRLPLAPLTQEAAERMHERAVSSFTRGLDALSGVLDVIQQRLGRTETVSEAQIEVLKQISLSLNQANERSEAVVAQLQTLPSILQSLQSSIDRQTSGLERRDQTLLEFRNTMADINQAIHELSSRQLGAMDRMGERHAEALQTLTQDHAGTMERIVGQQVEAWRSMIVDQKHLVERMTVDQQDLVERVTATNAEMLTELQKSQVEAIEEVNQRQTQAFERNQQRSLDLFSQAQAENIGVFARVQAEQARNMTEVLARSQNAYKYLIITMMMLVTALVVILALKL